LGSFNDDGTQLWPTSTQERWMIFADISDVAAVLYRMVAE
jgi:hypothetical protein